MNLVIHDLDEEAWKKAAPAYEGWRVVSDRGDARPCVGCFGCWLKTPGRCVLQDGYDRMGDWIHEAEEMVVISRCTYGGCSSSVKTILDRSIGYVLPTFRIVNGEMHHRPRYRETKPVSFLFRGHALSEADKERARKYAKAVCTNLHGRLKEIRFEEEAAPDAPAEAVLSAPAEAQETLFLNGSLRGDAANTKSFLDLLADRVGGEVLRLNLSASQKNPAEPVPILLSARTLVLGMPMYVDGVPSAVLKLMELTERACAGSGAPVRDKTVYVVANMGFYESRQLENLLGMVKSWCEKCGFTYGGGVAVGAGEMMGQVLRFGDNGPGKYVYEDLLKLAEAIKTSASVGDLYTKANRFPRPAYFLAANANFKRLQKKKD